VKDTIKALVEAWGPPGYEHHVRALIREMVAPYADEITTDPLGNLICRVGSGGPKVMVAAHMDEIGLMATFAEPTTGYLRFTAMGGLGVNTLIGNRVRFEDGTVGVIGVNGQYANGRKAAPTEIDQYYVDVSGGDGAPLIEPGSPAAFWREFEDRGGRLVAKSMDDRIGCAVAVEAMKRLNKTTPNEVYFAFTVQEEVGLRGAGAAAYRIAPDVAIALDVTATGDEAKGEPMTVKLGGGAAVKLMDAGHIVPPAVRDWMIARAEADGVRYQREILTISGTTDASRIQIAREGVPSGCISIPCRFVHTTSETVDTGDVEACVALLTGLLANPVSLAG
jgi:endoglucanase